MRSIQPLLGSLLKQKTLEVKALIGTLIALIVTGAIIASIPLLKDVGEAIYALGVLGFACLIAGMIIDATSGMM